MQTQGVVTKEEEDASKLMVKYRHSEDSTHNTSERDDASVKLSDEQDIESQEILSPETSLRVKQEEFKSRISQEE